MRSRKREYYVLYDGDPIMFQVSRALILKKAADYIQFMRRKNSAHQQDIDDLKRQNSLLESQSEL
jgi:Max protein